MVVVTVDPEGQAPDQLLGAVQDLGIVIEAQFVFESGEEGRSSIRGRGFDLFKEE